MDGGRREWVDRLIQACDLALARLELREDADLELVADIEELRARLQAEAPDTRSGHSRNPPGGLAL